MEASLPGSTTSKQPEHNLSDMPAPWLDQLAATLVPEAALALVRACRPMRDLVLAERDLRLYLQLPIAATAMGAARTKLQLACKYSLRVKLQLRATNQPWAGAQQVFTDINASAITLFMFHGMGPLPITVVELEGLVLDALVPSWLILGCPNMSSLQLQLCSFTLLPECNMSIPTCPQLKQLRLLGTPLLTDQLTVLRWQHQLEALPGLQSLTLNTTPQQLHLWLGCCSIVGTQLTQLIISTPLCATMMPPQFPSWFPRIRDLQLPGIQLQDADMGALLTMTSIRHLAVANFVLVHSYSTCPWVKLSVGALDIRSLAMMPLDSLQSFSVIPPPPLGPPFAIGPCADLHLARKVVAAIIKRGGVQWGDTDRISIGQCGASDCARVAELLPLMSGCRATTLTVWHARPVTAALLANLQPFMAALPLIHMRFQDCTWEGGAVGLVLPSLPPNVHTLALEAVVAAGQGDDDEDDEEQLTEAQFTRMCVKAVRPVTVWVSGYSSQWQAGWQRRVRAAMAAAGHQHVTLVNQ